MSIIKKDGLGYLIPMCMFDTCLIDNVSKKSIGKMYLGKDVTKHKSCYLLQKFEYHLRINFSISLKDYCIQYLKLE